MVHEPNAIMEEQENEAGAVFVFNYDHALKTQFNPQRYFCQSVLTAFCPKAKSCPRHVQTAFYEMRVSPIDSSNWEALDSFTRHGQHQLNPASKKEEQDFVIGENTSKLGFIPYIVAIWSDRRSVHDHIHRSLLQNNTDGYVGYTMLEIVKTIEEFHTMCREVDLGFDTVVKEGKYLYPRGSDHPLKPEIMSGMGFVPAE
jgi:hypothetical protein